MSVASDDGGSDVVGGVGAAAFGRQPRRLALVVCDRRFVIGDRRWAAMGRRCVELAAHCPERLPHALGVVGVELGLLRGRLR